MPELSRFFGIIIRMHMEVGEPHHLPHFHAYYQDHTAVFGLRANRISSRIIASSTTAACVRAELHLEELKNDWQLLQGDQLPLPIDPLA